jgi:radical SAM protein with 4Fe4S-binding SPASM domain
MQTGATSSHQLKDGVFFVPGASRGALLDTNTGRVYSVNDEASAVLRHEAGDEAYWETLVSLELAERTTDARAQALPRKETDRLAFAWFEIVTDDCNERCAHCYADSMPRTYRKSLKQALSVVCDEPARPRMTHADWLAVIDEAARLGARACQFIGGEPFLYRGPNGETVLDLVHAAVQAGFSLVEIFSNGTLITRDKAMRLKELGARVAVSLYSDQAEVHDAITRTPGSHAKTTAALALLRELGVPVRAEVVLMQLNQHTIESTLTFRKERDLGDRAPDPLRPKGRGDDPRLQPDFEHLVRHGLLVEPNFVAERETIAHYSSGHSCLLGKIAVTEFGEVFPCIFSRNHAVGNLLVSRELGSILRDAALRRFWSATKDQVMVCRDCEYRYVCFDCRPLSEASAAGRSDYLHAPYPRCTYNPYTGEWAAGLWKVDEAGNPFYDRSRAAQIQQVASTMTSEQRPMAGH